MQFIEGYYLFLSKYFPKSIIRLNLVIIPKKTNQKIRGKKPLIHSFQFGQKNYRLNCSIISIYRYIFKFRHFVICLVGLAGLRNSNLIVLDADRVFFQISNAINNLGYFQISYGIAA